MCRVWQVHLQLRNTEAAAQILQREMPPALLPCEQHPNGTPSPPPLGAGRWEKADHAEWPAGVKHRSGHLEHL